LDRHKCKSDLIHQNTIGEKELSKYFLKTKSPTFAELLADRGHPSPKIFYTKIR
jgi:hypothetical protein